MMKDVAGDERFFEPSWLVSPYGEYYWQQIHYCRPAKCIQSDWNQMIERFYFKNRYAIDQIPWIEISKTQSITSASMETYWSWTPNIVIRSVPHPFPINFLRYFLYYVSPLTDKRLEEKPYHLTNSRLDLRSRTVNSNHESNDHWKAFNIIKLSRFMFIYLARFRLPLCDVGKVLLPTHK